MTTTEIEEARDSVIGVTAGPLVAVECTIAKPFETGEKFVGVGNGSLCIALCGNIGCEQSETDARFFAKARDLVPKLAAECLRLRRAIEASGGLCVDCGHTRDSHRYIEGAKYTCWAIDEEDGPCMCRGFKKVVDTNETTT